MTVSIGYQADGVTSICGTNLLGPLLLGRRALRPDHVRRHDQRSRVRRRRNPFQAFSLTFPVDADAPYYVFVDGYDNG